jgi:hypothetical protein
MLRLPDRMTAPANAGAKGGGYPDPRSISEPSHHAPDAK